MKDIYKTRIAEIAEGHYKDLLVILANRRTTGTSISRSELAYRMNISDRVVRRLISQARKSRFPIISDHNESGYYLSNNIDEIEAFRKREIQSRISDLRETDEGMIMAIKEIENNYSVNQISIMEVLGNNGN